MQVVLGVDGGNTKTVALAADLDGVIRGVGRAGSSNWETAGEREAVAALTQCVTQALQMAGVGMDSVLQAHLGLAGLDWPDDERRLRQALEGGWPGGLNMENDAFLGVRACSPDGRGIGVTAGTGVCACYIPMSGEPFFYGAFTDLGGGIDIDDQILQAIVRAEDGRGLPTAMTAPLLAAAGCAKVTDLAYAITREGLRLSSATLRPILFRAAEGGDPAAAAIVGGFGRELALCATSIIRRRGFKGDGPPIVASGSLFTQTGKTLFQAFRQDVLAAAPWARVILAQYPPVLGAVRAAFEECGRFTAAAWEQVRLTVPEKSWFQTAGVDEGELDRPRSLGD